MPLTLDPALAGRMDEMKRQPLARIVSSDPVESIPFDGERLTLATHNETRSNTIMHSSGRLLEIHNHWLAGDDYFRYVYTDINRVEFNYVTLAPADLGFADQTVIEASLCELVGGNIGLIFVTQDDNNFYLRRAVLSVTGAVQSYALIASYAKSSFPTITSPFVIRLDDNSYFAVYIKKVLTVPDTGGTYTGTTNSKITLEITTEGNQTTAWFKWRKDGGGWSAPIQCTGGWQTLDEGIQVRFNPGAYWVKQHFWFAVKAATKASAVVWVTANPLPSDTTVIGSVTYTWVNTLTGAPNEVVIDPLGMEISLQNLMCAINDEDFEGTGEGIRYGNGTVENPDVEAMSREEYYLTLQAKAAGSGGNSLTLTTDGTRLHDTDFSGGSDTDVLDADGMPGAKIYKRTSSNFLSWSGEAEISITALSAQRKDHCSLIQVDSGTLFLLFDNYDDPDYSNIYYMTSPNGGMNWGAPVTVTSYSSAGAMGKHPVAVQKQADQMHLAFHEVRGAMHMDKATPGWCGNPTYSAIGNLHFDPVTRKLYAVNLYPHIGIKRLEAVIEVDVDTWDITDCWSFGTVPAFNKMFNEQHVWYLRHHGERHLVPVGVTETANKIYIAVLDAEADKITAYNFMNWPWYGLVKNVDYTPDTNYEKLGYTWIDYDSMRLYILIYQSAGYPYYVRCGWIDLIETIEGDEKYTWNQVVKDTSWTQAQMSCLNEGYFGVYPNSDRIIISTYYPTLGSSWEMRLKVYNLQTGGIEKDYYRAVAGGFPIHGLNFALLHENKIYGGIFYESAYGEGDKRGLCVIDLVSDGISYQRPSWATLDNYYLTEGLVTPDGLIAMTSAGYGVTIFDPGTLQWELFDNGSVPGLTPDGKENFYPIAYDPSGLFFIGAMAVGDWSGFLMFSRYGMLRRAYYIIGNKA